MARLSPEVLALRDEIVALRRDLHRHPELAWNERRTAEQVARSLTGQGLELRTGLGGTSRETIVCSVVMTWAAATTGSAERCGLPPWPPRPRTTMRRRSTAAISGPVFTPSVPTGSSFQR